MIKKDKICYEPNPCEDYMYKLSQEWGNEGKWCIFIMLNPATANEEELIDNRTVKNCRTIAEREECSGMILIDLFPYIAGNWRELLQAKKDGEDILGPQDEHDASLHEVLETENAIIIVAWGDNPKNRPNHFKREVGFDDRVEHMKQMIIEHATDKELKYIKGRKGKRERVRHPLWLANANRIGIESDEERDQRIKKEVEENCELIPFKPK